MKNTIISIFFSFSIVSPLLLITSCGSGDINDLNQTRKKDTVTIDASGNYTGSITIELRKDSPKVSKQANGRTNVVLQFVPRDNRGFSLSSEQIEVTFSVNDKPIGIESYLQSTANELQFNVNFGLVLDTSYSMVNRQALAPMLTAAKDSVQSGLDIWADKGSQFTFYTSWFNDYIFYANSTSENAWTPEDILDIPSPDSSENSATKLFSAVDYMVSKFNAIPTNNDDTNLPDDQNIILVFSDGEDNFSWYNNEDEEPESLLTEGNAEFTKIGYKDVSDTELLEKLESSENLTVHVIGLGNTIDKNVLPKIAQSGKGTYQNNPESDELTSVFDSVVREFTTLQTRGASMTLPPGDYKFTLQVKNKNGGLVTNYAFRFNTNNENAMIVPR